VSDVGRPSLYTPELAAEICRRIGDGESLRQVCRDESMPCTTTVLKWAREIEEFAQQYAKAREALLEHWAEEITEIADDGSNDWIKREKGEGRVEIVLDAEHVNRSRLRIDTRKWLLSKLAAKKYGDRISAELSGPDGGPIETKGLTDSDLAREVAFLLTSAVRKQDTVQ
jgi:hypothetical protein